MSKLHDTFTFVPAVTGLLLATALLSTACDTDASEPTDLRAGAGTVEAAPPVPVADPPAPTGTLAEQLDRLQPIKTRAGWLRYADPVINQPEAAPILLARLIAGQDAPEIRVALAEAIGRTGGDYAAAVSTQLASEGDARVREMLVGTLGRTADTPDARPGLQLCLSDVDAQVRAAAVRTIGSRSDAGEFGDRLIAALADEDDLVRRDAARTLGVLGQQAAIEPLTVLLSSQNPDLRLHGLRAIHRIDPGAAASLGVLSQLEQDEDPRVQQLVGKIRTGQ